MIVRLGRCSTHPLAGLFDDATTRPVYHSTLRTTAPPLAASCYDVRGFGVVGLLLPRSLASAADALAC